MVKVRVHFAGTYPCYVIYRCAAWDVAEIEACAAREGADAVTVEFAR